MMQLLKFIVFGTAIFLVGCANPHIASDYRISEDKGRGVVWGTITYDDQFADYQLHYKNNQTGEVGFLQAELVNLEGFKGGLFVVALPSGPYTLTGWKLSTPYYSTSLIEMNNTFTNKAGHVNYIGRIHFSRFSQLSQTFSGVTYRDHMKQDQVLLSGMYPNLDCKLMLSDIDFINTTFCEFRISDGADCIKTTINTPVR
ncbi:hypothetical protein [Pseudoalteromonas luteoviolacea]|uniref:Lipoprotein n=1 Tax=Pseudoalteromonas luteoviolacea S4060-1 TaxID=1365257 RepID=A0A167LPC7_9GAMM|nr:hypothetical protein [Pseudoalteromonas luteoviolacea]KZN64966.1 hypothetical protein N478_02885 [Pseudoalteromonas luteoviolacea S4060-1]